MAASAGERESQFLPVMRSRHKFVDILTHSLSYTLLTMRKRTHTHILTLNTDYGMEVFRFANDPTLVKLVEPLELSTLSGLIPPDILKSLLKLDKLALGRATIHGPRQTLHFS